MGRGPSHVKHTLTYSPAQPLLAIPPREMSVCPQDIMYTNAHHSFVPDTQNPSGPPPTNGRADNRQRTVFRPQKPLLLSQGPGSVSGTVPEGTRSHTGDTDSTPHQDLEEVRPIRMEKQGSWKSQWLPLGGSGHGGTGKGPREFHGLEKCLFFRGSGVIGGYIYQNTEKVH